MLPTLYATVGAWWEILFGSEHRQRVLCDYRFQIPRGRWNHLRPKRSMRQAMLLGGASFGNQEIFSTRIRGILCNGMIRLKATAAWLYPHVFSRQHAAMQKRNCVLFCFYSDIQQPFRLNYESKQQENSARCVLLLLFCG